MDPNRTTKLANCQKLLASRQMKGFEGNNKIQTYIKNFFCL